MTHLGRGLKASGQAGSYFDRFGSQLNPAVSFAANFKRLAKDQGWSKKEQKTHRFKALERKFDIHVGKDVTKLKGWQRICEECQVEPVPSSIPKDKEALGKVHVNIYNFTDHPRNAKGFPLKIFPNLKVLQEYSLPDLVYPRKRAKEDSFLRALLRRLHHNENVI